MAAGSKGGIVWVVIGAAVAYSAFSWGQSSNERDEQLRQARELIGCLELRAHQWPMTPVEMALSECTPTGQTRPVMIRK
jgi:hypothetical protein